MNGDLIYWWIRIATYLGGDAAGLLRFIRGNTLKFLLAGLVAMNLLIFATVLVRCFRRRITDWDFPR